MKNIITLLILSVVLASCKKDDINIDKTNSENDISGNYLLTKSITPYFNKEGIEEMYTHHYAETDSTCVFYLELKKDSTFSYTGCNFSDKIGTYEVISNDKMKIDAYDCEYEYDGVNLKIHNIILNQTGFYKKQ